MGGMAHQKLLPRNTTILSRYIYVDVLIRFNQTTASQHPEYYVPNFRLSDIDFNCNISTTSHLQNAHIQRPCGHEYHLLVRLVEC